MWAGVLLGFLMAAEATASSPAGVPCPSSGELESELARVGAAGVAIPGIAIVQDKMRVDLRGRDGAPVGSREVEVPQTCHERATVAAVLVATWMGIWRGEPIPVQPAQPVVRAAPTPPPRAGAQRRTEIGLTGTGAYDGNAAAVGLAVEARLRLAGPLWAWAGLAATSERERAVGPGKAGYLRPTLELGPAVQLGAGRVRADLAVAGMLGVSVVRGKDLAVTHANAHVTPGAAAAARLMLARPRLSPFLVATVSYWLAGQEVRLDDDPSIRVALPRWDAGAGVGFFWAP